MFLKISYLINKLKKLIKLNHSNINLCENLLLKNIKDYNYFKEIGWNSKQYKLQIKKEVDFSFGLIEMNLLIGFIIGDLITIKKNLEYEILFLYIAKEHRNKGNATFLINSLVDKKIDISINKIILEVDSSNNIGNNFYKKNNFVQTGLRKNYYSFNSKKTDALLYEKIIHEQ